MTVRGLTAGDRDAVREALVESRAFTEQEIRVALDMVDAGLQGDYSLTGMEVDGAVRAYACFGKAVLTAGSWYLYWICVHPAWQRCGLGQTLQAEVEAAIRRAGGERIVVETSGRPDYEHARRFYQRAGYTEVGRIPGFYKPGDDCVLYCKVLGGES